MAELITVKVGLQPLLEKIKKRIAQVQVSDERLLEYWSQDLISERGKEYFEEFKAWIEKRGISLKTLTEFFLKSGYSATNAEVEAEKLLLSLPKSLGKRFDDPDVREIFKALVDVLEENKEYLSVDIEDVLKEIERLAELQNELLSLYSDRQVLLSPLLFTSRNDVKDMLKFEFVGRVEELKKLHEFLEGDLEVMAVFGEGGSGKTRLLIEFANQVEGNVYFVHPVNSIERVRIEDAVLILDDASKYRYFDKVLDLSVNPESWGVKNVKLIILDRNYFKDKMEDRLKAKKAHYSVLELDGGDITEFVRVNFGIAEADQIAAESENNFFYASVLAEHFEKSGEIDLLGALEYRVEKYIEDVRERPGIRSNEELAIYILSLIMPVDMKRDSEALKKIFDFNRFCLAMESDLVKKVDKREYVIKPDPVGDYIRFRFMKRYRDESDGYIKDFLLYMPFRVTYNVTTISRLKKDALEVSQEVLGSIWEDLNKRDFESPEYFAALVFLLLT